jgi:hypothetical protein
MVISSSIHLPASNIISFFVMATQLFSSEIGSHELFCPGWPGMVMLPISVQLGMTDTCHHAQLLVEMGVLLTFSLGLTLNHIL